MSYPNSQTPVTIRLTRLFSNPATLIAAGGLKALRASTPPLGDLAIAFNVVTGPLGKAHVDAWPLGQQQLVLDAMIRALETSTTISFDWQEDPNTSTDIVTFDPTAWGVTFRSPP